MEIALVKDYLANYLSKPVPTLVKRELAINVAKGKAATIIGPRRAGKTSLMWQEISGYNRKETIYLDFEDVALKG
ncbi:MAG: AAA family ATPase, partial [Candidatus Micrarchaeaceae archaeon]